MSKHIKSDFSERIKKLRYRLRLRTYFPLKHFHSLVVNPPWFLIKTRFNIA